MGRSLNQGREKDFHEISRPTLDFNHRPVEWVTRFIARVQGDWGVMLNTHRHLNSRLEISGLFLRASYILSCHAQEHLRNYKNFILVIKPTDALISQIYFWNKNPDDGHRNCPKHVEFYSKNKFEKLVHLLILL